MPSHAHAAGKLRATLRALQGSVVRAGQLTAATTAWHPDSSGVSSTVLLRFDAAAGPRSPLLFDPQSRHTLRLRLDTHGARSDLSVTLDSGRAVSSLSCDGPALTAMLVEQAQAHMLHAVAVAARANGHALEDVSTSGGVTLRVGRRLVWVTFAAGTDFDLVASSGDGGLAGQTIRLSDIPALSLAARVRLLLRQCAEWEG